MDLDLKDAIKLLVEYSADVQKLNDIREIKSDLVRKQMFEDAAKEREKEVVLSEKILKYPSFEDVYNKIKDL